MLMHEKRQVRRHAGFDNQSGVGLRVPRQAGPVDRDTLTVTMPDEPGLLPSGGCNCPNGCIGVCIKTGGHKRCQGVCY